LNSKTLTLPALRRSRGRDCRTAMPGSERSHFCHIVAGVYRLVLAKHSKEHPLADNPASSSTASGLACGLPRNDSLFFFVGFCLLVMP